MQTQEAYNHWANTYDTVTNPTRDLEGMVLRSVLKSVQIERIIEIGCGTGKNTPWLAAQCNQLTAIDFSEEMLQIAKGKIKDNGVQFLQADITTGWKFGKANLITCSLVLEHIKDISFIFKQAAETLESGGLFYICELHPYKQLQGSCAKFEKDGNLQQLEYFIHHISDYFYAAQQYSFVCDDLKEWFDSDDHTQTPRLVSYIFRKNSNGIV